MKRSLLLISATLCLFMVSSVHAQPSLTNAAPSAAAPGKAIEITLQGAKLNDPRSVWTSFPAKVEILADKAGKKSGKTAKIRLTLDASVGVGVGGIVVATPAGASSVLLIMVDDLPSAADNGKNHSLATAQEIVLPTAVDGVGDGVNFDFYKFAAKAGQRISVEAVAGRLGSSFDPIIRLLDAKGAELAMADDDAGLGADCRFTHTFKADGQYIIELRDVRYRGGGRYRLRLGDFPLVTAPYPMGGRLGSTAKFTFAGPAVEGVIPVFLKIPEQVPGKRLAISAKYPNGKSSAMATVAASSLPEELEREPNNKIENATPVTLPCAVNGALQADKDRDHFQFAAKKGQRFNFKAISRSLGSPSYLFMRLYNPKGAQISETAIGAQDETQISATIPEDGVYRLMVEDLLHRGGADFAYRVEIELENGFTLSLKNDKATKDKFLTSAGGGFSLTVQCKRSGYNGPIQLSLDPSVPGMKIYNSVIPAKAASAKIFVVGASPANIGDLHMLRIVGKAMVDGKQASSIAHTTDLVRARRPQLPYPPTWIDGLLTVSLAADAAPFYTAKPDRQTIYFSRQLGEAQFSIQLARTQKEYKDPLTVVVEGLPSGFTSAVKRIGNGPKEQYQITLKGPKNLPEGRHTLSVISYGEFKGRGQTVLARDIPIQVVNTLSASVAMVGPIEIGLKQKVKITITRPGDASQRQPVTIKWTKLPPGIPSPGEVTIPADQTEIEIELSAAADAKVGKHTDLTIQAITLYNGQSISAQSAAAALEIITPKPIPLPKPAKKK